MFQVSRKRIIDQSLMIFVSLKRTMWAKNQLSHLKIYGKNTHMKESACWDIKEFLGIVFQ